MIIILQLLIDHQCHAIYTGRMAVSRHLSFAKPARWRRRNVLVAATAIFALGFAAGATVKPALMPSNAGADDTPPALPPTARDAGLTSVSNQSAPKIEPQLAYPSEVVRVIDGDTFEARVRVWPGLQVDTKVRLRGIDAPELRARCEDERSRAEAARAALETILAQGGVAISRVGIDKYGGRVDAVVSTRSTTDVSAALLGGGWVRSYDGGRRAGWC